MNLDVVQDPLLTPLLEIVQRQVNEEMQLADEAFRSDEAIARVEAADVNLVIANGKLPLLSAFRVRSRLRQRTMRHHEHVETVRFSYITPEAGNEQTASRWPLLDRIWREMWRAFEVCWPDIEALGVVEINRPSAQKREMYAPHGDFSFPAWVADVDISWRDLGRYDQSALAAFERARGSLFCVDAPRNPPRVEVDLGGDVVLDAVPASTE